MDRRKPESDDLSSFQSFVQSVATPSGFRVEHLRAVESDEYIGNENKGYCLQTGVSAEYASTNTPQQIRMSERVGRAFGVMVQCLHADCGLP